MLRNAAYYADNASNPFEESVYFDEWGNSFEVEWKAYTSNAIAELLFDAYGENPENIKEILKTIVEVMELTKEQNLKF